MASPKDSIGRAEGFEGAVAGLSLADVIQLNSTSRFSGCISVHYGASQGLIFFRDGDVVHAEQGTRTGADAFFDIMEWRTGRFSVQPNLATTSRTIQMSAQHLLMEAHRVIDERRAGRGTGGSQADGDGEPESWLARVRRIPGLAYAVVIAKDGRTVDDPSYEAETLAGQAGYLSLVAARLGNIFKAGPAQAAAVNGAERHVLLLVGKGNGLAVLVHGNADVGAVEAEVRKVLAAARG